MCVFSCRLFAHEVQPAVLQLTQAGNGVDWEVLFKQPYKQSRIGGRSSSLKAFDLAVITNCVASRGRQRTSGVMLEQRFTLECIDAPLSVMSINGIEQTLIDVIVTVNDGQAATTRYLLNARQPSIEFSSDTAIPVFLSRTFRHGAIFIRTDRGITEPRDLEGKTVGLVEYDMTAAVVVRGLLRDEYGVDTTKIRWRVGDPEVPWRETIPIPDVPDGTDVAPVADGQTLNDALASGALDALCGIEPPSCFTAGAPGVDRLFPDWRSVERDYFGRTGIFPIMHAVGIKRELLDANPWLGAELFKAFESAKDLALRELAVMNAPKATLPWVAAELQATKNAMGEDYWPYGIDKNRDILEILIRYSFEDGLTTRRLGIDELFAPSMLDT